MLTQPRVTSPLLRSRARVGNAGGDDKTGGTYSRAETRASTCTRLRALCRVCMRFDTSLYAHAQRVCAGG
eukprot:4376578-Prymnesium_polylepis.1